MARDRHAGPYNEWVRETRTPAPRPPSGSIDCQFHIYAPASQYPPRPDAPYPPIDGTLADALRMHAALRFGKGVIVHSAIYGSDHSLLVDALESLPQPRCYRGTANLADDTSDKEIERLSRAGVVAARINFLRYMRARPDAAQAMRIFDRLREIGWHARLHVDAEDLIEHADLLKRITDVPILIEHMGHMDFTAGINQPACRFMLDMLKHENWWVMVSNGNRDSRYDTGWEDAIPFGAACAAAAPERTVWGSDWPHPTWHKPMMNDAETVELLYRYVDHDMEIVRRILVDNPSRLYGFE